MGQGSSPSLLFFPLFTVLSALTAFGAGALGAVFGWFQRPALTFRFDQFSVESCNAWEFMTDGRRKGRRFLKRMGGRPFFLFSFLLFERRS